MSSEDGDRAVFPATNVQEYFKDLLGSAQKNQGVQVEPPTEFYLVDLLARYLDAEELFPPTPEGSREEEPLALMLARALEQDSGGKVAALRKLGDTSLYISGFFADSLGRKLVNADYYIAMGGHAYSQVRDLVRAAPGGGRFTTIYSELSGRFATIVSLFCEISERSSLSSNRAVLRLYESWLRTGSARLSRLLVDRGLLPAEFISKKNLLQ